MQAIIETKNVTHRYGKFTAVNNLSMAVEQGEIFGFLGPNGAGKTTTIRMMLDFIRPDAGSIHIMGKDARQDAVTIRQNIGYLPSELKLWENWRGVDYIGWLEGVHKKPLMQEANRLAGLLEFDLKRKLQGMSTGMKRKMGLIAAMSHKPQLLILDEPTSGLDPLMQQVFNHLMQQARAEGRTVFLSSHMLTEVEQICDRVGIIRGGELQAVESVDRLTHVTFRWLTLMTKGAAHPNGFAQIRGVSELSTLENTLRMKISGDVDLNEIFRQATQYDIADIQIEKPTLEEIFLAFYGSKES